MTQYYLIVNISSNEYIEVYDENPEQLPEEDRFSLTTQMLPFLLWCESGSKERSTRNVAKQSGRWTGDRIVLIEDIDDGTLCQFVKEHYSDISSQVQEEFYSHPSSEVSLKVPFGLSHLSTKDNLEGVDPDEWF